MGGFARNTNCVHNCFLRGCFYVFGKNKDCVLIKFPIGKFGVLKASLGFGDDVRYTYDMVQYGDATKLWLSFECLITDS